MPTISKIFPLLLLASAFGVNSCVNEVKTPPKEQAKPQDTLSQLRIIYAIPDSNDMLAVNFHIALTPPWQKNFRIDWNFGDSSDIISKFDTSILPHYYRKFGTYQVILSVIDTSNKTLLGKTSVIVDLENNFIDTNFFHAFNKIRVSFLGYEQYVGTNGENQQNNEIAPTDQVPEIGSASLLLQWNGRNFQLSRDTGYYYSDYRCGYNAVVEQYGYFQAVHGKISENGRMLDSLSDIFNDHIFRNEQHYYEDRYDFKSIVLHSLPLVTVSQNSIVFSYRGTSLQDKVTSLRDGTSGTMGGIGSIMDTLHTVTWDLGTPVLTVTFSK